tara:strand:- start:160 stop:393 length:234 start_codon:yes stop_codon:yes gene_type:complete
MTQQDLEIVILEADRFLEKAKELLRCTHSADNYTSGTHYQEFKYDLGLNSKSQISKRKAAVKRAALDLRQELLKVTK